MARVLAGTNKPFRRFKNSLGNRHHLQDIHAHPGVVVELLHKPAVYDVPLWEDNWMMTLIAGEKNRSNI